MQKEKKTKERLRRRAKYEVPQAWCISIEVEGILAVSGSSGPSFGGSTGDGANTINKQETGLLNSAPGFGGGIIGGSSGGQASIGMVETGIL